MTAPTRRARVETLFTAALEVQPARRASFVTAACGADEALAAEVLELLRHHRASWGLLDAPAFETCAFADLEGRRIGPYRLRRRLAAGGMGVVHEAEDTRDGRRVAIKTVRGGPFVEARSVPLFEREIRALSRLEHPSIAALHDAGRTEDGLHWFAMERVDGVPLDAWVRRHRPDTRERVRLVAAVADALEFAHGRGVVHCDLKPSNVLVIGAGTVKVLDFGLARLVDESAGTRSSLASPWSGTPAYMSPEQVRGGRAVLDARSDVYSLGVTLFEVLTLALPHDLDGLPLPEVARRIEHAPARRAGDLRRDVRGDLELVLQQALDKDADRRYPSACAFADDLRRFLDGREVRARPAGAWVRFRRLVRRHPRASSAALTLLLVLSTSLALVTHAWIGRRAAERAARADADVARRVSDFLANVLGSVTPVHADGHEATVGEVIEAAVARVGAELSDQPGVAARVRLGLGRSLLGLGRVEEAEEQLRLACEALDADRPVDGPVPATARCDLAKALTAVGRLEEAREQYEAALAGDDVIPKLRAELLEGLGGLDAARGRDDRAARRYRQALEVLDAAPSVDPWPAVSLRSRLGVLLRRLDRQDEAAETFRAALDGMRAVVGDEHPDVATLWNNLGCTLRDAGRLDAGETALRRSLELRRRLLEPSHPYIASSVHNLGLLHARREEWDRAEASLREALDHRRAHLDAGSPSVAISLASLASVLDHQGRRSEAMALAEESLAALEAALPSAHPFVERARRLVERCRSP